jgi:glycosyltransferase involved in cell wall biosynthesis
MHILIASRTLIPVVTYGGTERVIWDLGKALSESGHQVTYLVAEGSQCDFARVLHLRDDIDLLSQIPQDVDIVHFHFLPPGLDLDRDLGRPYLYTEHGNSAEQPTLPLNAIFLSSDHARRHGSNRFIYNGLDWRQYGTVDLDNTRRYFHFLGKAAWRVKNVTGAIDVALKAKQKLFVLGGNRLNIKRGFRFTLSPRVTFHGMVGGAHKLTLLNGSCGLIFPVRWHEPFGLAVIESLYFGCAVYATPYGSLPELVTPDCGALSNSATKLAHAVAAHSFETRACHARATTHFSAHVMCRNYVDAYERVLAGEQLNANPPKLQPGYKDLSWGA